MKRETSGEKQSSLHWKTGLSCTQAHFAGSLKYLVGGMPFEYTECKGKIGIWECIDEILTWQLQFSLPANSIN